MMLDAPSPDVVIRGSICTFETPAVASLPHKSKGKSKKKHVRWGTVTALEFRIGYNACSVPGSAGPPVGLLGGPIRYTVTTPSSTSDAGDDATCPASGWESRRSKEDLWLCPMDRVKILSEETGLLLEEITAICSDVSAVLDARALSKFDHVAHRIIETLEMSRNEDLRKLRETFHQDNRKKIMLF
ncbi:hypothetical protein PybrP1_002578 [[Pythium] brassicae (nom. inval.)]|nr:hypothetical protein PybrP1_002578 [[Pythium] brassicae (nom. inval.)]